MCDDIVGDGNCLFRFISKVISGSENYHIKLRGEICRYIITQGRKTMGWYVVQVHSKTPAQHLRTSNMSLEGVWGGDVELMAISAILECDVYVANRYNQIGNTFEVRWSRIRSSDNSRTNAINSIYISNFGFHYAPVCKMFNSTTKTYFANVDSFQEVVLVE